MVNQIPSQTFPEGRGGCDVHFVNEETGPRGPQLVSGELELGAGLFSMPKFFTLPPTLNCQPYANASRFCTQGGTRACFPLLCFFKELYTLSFQYDCVTCGYAWVRFLKECAFFKAGPCLIYLGRHSAWHIVATQYGFVELVKGRVRMLGSREVCLIKGKGN